MCPAECRQDQQDRRLVIAKKLFVRAYRGNERQPKAKDQQDSGVRPSPIKVVSAYPCDAGYYRHRRDKNQRSLNHPKTVIFAILINDFLRLRARTPA